MAKARTQRDAPAQVETTPPPVAPGKKAKKVTTAAKKKTAAKTAPAKAAAPKMAPAVTTTARGKAPPAKTIAAKTKAQVPSPSPKKGAAKTAAAPTATAKAAGTKAAGTKTAAPKVAAGKSAPQKAAVPETAARTKTAGRKAAAPETPAKIVAVKTVPPRRPVARAAAPIPSARRGRPALAPRKAPTATPHKAPATAGKLGSGGPQVFTVSHLNEADFKADGLRTYAQYRDLGIAAATGGLCQAHVIRLIPPCTDEVRKRHVHQADLQLVYVLKGWMKNEFEGHGEQMMSAGSCWLQPSGIKHTVLDYSADCEVLEIIVPADFKTEELA
jgi:hypothetical protein